MDISSKAEDTPKGVDMTTSEKVCTISTRWKICLQSQGQQHNLEVADFKTEIF